jgi:hypothetical protein
MSIFLASFLKVPFFRFFKMATDLRTKRTSENQEYYEEDYDADVPEEVCQYLVYFHEMLAQEKVPDILGLYEHGFPEMTERYFSEKKWPDHNVVERIIGPAFVYPKSDEQNG